MAGRVLLPVSGHRARRRTVLKRTAKSCGGKSAQPGADKTLIRETTVTKKPGRRGEHEVSRKTIACGNAGFLRWTCGDYARVFVLFHTRGCGCIDTRHSPRPLFFRA